MVRPRQFSDAEILEGARRCFIEHGPAISTNHIADEVGVSQATLFKRFGTKHELMLAALCPRPNMDFLRRVEAGPTDAPMHTQLLDMATHMALMFDRMLPCLMTLWASGTNPHDMFPDPEQAPPVRARRALGAFFGKAQAEGRMAPGDTEALALVFIGAVKEAAFQRHMLRDAAPKPEPVDYAKTLVHAFWHGTQPAVTP